MIEVDLSQIDRSIFDFDIPGKLRLESVFDGNMLAKAWMEDSGAVIQETTFGTLFLGGNVKPDSLAGLIEERRKHGDVLYGYWPEHEAEVLALFPEPQYRGFVLEFIDCPTPPVYPVPEGCELCAIDAELFTRIQDYEFYSTMFGSPERALSEGFGFCLMRGDDILCEAFASVKSGGMIELGVNTWEGHRRKGCAAVTCAYLIRECENRGYQTYWNCAEQNVASAQLARKLGYRHERRYGLFGWF